MNERDERLRRLLRDADPAREAPELGAAEVARLRRTVLGAAEREPRAWLSRPTLSWAFAAAVAAIVVGLALWRLDLTWKPATGEDRTASAVPAQTPSSRHAAPASTARDASLNTAGSSTVATTKPGGPPVLTTSATGAHAEVASAHRSGTNQGPRIGPRSSPRATHSPASTAEPSAAAPPETIAAAQPPSEPQQPYQLQLTAPGGTRIVWLLTSSSGR